MGKIIRKRVEYGGSSNSAENIKYNDNKNVKEVIDEVKSEIAGVKSSLGITLKYNENTDSFGFYHNGEWLDIISAGIINFSVISEQYPSVNGTMWLIPNLEAVDSIAFTITRKTSYGSLRIVLCNAILELPSSYNDGTSYGTAIKQITAEGVSKFTIQKGSYNCIIIAEAHKGICADITVKRA